MNRISAIQVIVDPLATAHPCVDKAEALAERFGARVELLICDTKAARQTRAIARFSRAESDMPAEPEPLISSLAARLRAKGIEATTCVDFAEPLHEGLLKHTRNTAADLVVKDTHHHSLIKRSLVTNTDWHLIRGCSAPLLLTKATPWSGHPTVIVALDPGHVNDKPAVLDRDLLRWGDLLCKQLHGTLHAAHAYIPATILAATPGTMPPLAGVITEATLNAEKSAKIATIRGLAAGIQLADRHIHTQFGTAADYLPKIAAQLNADVLVAGAVSRGSVARAFVGSTAERILEDAPCDVLVVKPADFAADLPF